MSPSDDDVRIPEELIPPVATTGGDKLIAALKKTAADPVLMAKIRKEGAEISAAVVAELLAMQQNDLTCIQCRLDGTVPFGKKNSSYTRSLLNKHLKSNYHTRREQVRRAFNIDKDDKSQCKCPCCPADDEKIYLQTAFLAHVESEHETTMSF